MQVSEAWKTKWAVNPGSLSALFAAEASLPTSVLTMLTSNSQGSALQRCTSPDPIAHAREPFSTALGLPICIAATNNIENFMTAETPNPVNFTS